MHVPVHVLTVEKFTSLLPGGGSHRPSGEENSTECGRVSRGQSSIGIVCTPS